MAMFAGDDNWPDRFIKIGYAAAGHDLKKNKNGLYQKVDGGPDKEGGLTKRQSPGCNTYGLDFQDGGNYFINTNSNASFTFVSSFMGCQNDTASVMLINQSTGDQYDCGSVPTVPDNAPELATCPVLKDQIASGDYLIIAVGNNGNGTPFAYQREFNISAGPQQTITNYYTPTVTSRPIVITTSTSIANYTSTVPNTLSTITVPSPVYTQTITPPRSAVTQVSTSTKTFTRWSQVDSSTATVVTPHCRTPIRPLHPDPICTVFPNKEQIPAGVPGVHRRAEAFGEPAPSPTTISTSLTSSPYTTTWSEIITNGKVSRFPIYPLSPKTASTASITRSLRSNDPHHKGQGGTGMMEKRQHEVEQPHQPAAQRETQNHIQKRAPDATAVTVTSPANTTVTLFASEPTTETNIEAFTSTYVVMDPAPQTVYAGQPVQTVMAAVQPVETVTQTSFVRAYETLTFGLTWTQTLTSTPSAALESCRAIGGNFGKWW